jgi:hypothetical protein
LNQRKKKKKNSNATPQNPNLVKRITKINKRKNPKHKPKEYESKTNQKWNKRKPSLPNLETKQY